eukprot:m.161849 g.161849  ORF g.161849 m.161849 type:complete len:434 (+) comp23849_c2_seq1:311-1612(+)
MAGAGAAVPIPVPTCWNEKDKSPLLEVTQGLSVKYQGRGDSDKDAASVRANHPIQPALGLFYFEVTIKNKGRDGYIGIGLCTSSTNTNRLPGWEKFSYGYHGDDGNAFSFSGTGNEYGPTFTTGDVIGCCVNYFDFTCFYTKNGTKLGVAFRDIDRKDEAGKSVRLYPSVGLRTPNEEIEANFGQTPFIFDIESEWRDLRVRARMVVEETVLSTAGWQHQLNQIVTSYLVHHGYADTARVLARDMDTRIDESEETIASRQKIRESVMGGEIEGAIAIVEETFPTVFPKNAPLLFRLRCRLFVEMIADAAKEAAGSPDNRYSDERLESILAFGQEVQTMFETSCNTTENRALIKEAFGLLAYPNPREGPMSHVLDSAKREPLANELNSAIMGSLSLLAKSKLEHVVQQASTCLSTMLDHGMGQAAFLSIDQFME